MSSGVSVAPEDSNGEAGTHEETITYASSGTSSASCKSARIPSIPNTFAISCGSRTTVVVPHGSAARANSSSRSFVVSRCMCPSMNPGNRISPDTSIRSVPS